jgi:hypothetical protein
VDDRRSRTGAIVHLLPVTAGIQSSGGPCSSSSCDTAYWQQHVTRNTWVEQWMEELSQSIGWTGSQIQAY